MPPTSEASHHPDHPRHHIPPVHPHTPHVHTSYAPLTFTPRPLPGSERYVDIISQHLAAGRPGSPAKRRGHEWRAGGREIRGHHLYVVLFKQGRSARPSRVRYGLSHGVPAFRGGRAWEPGVRDSPGDNNREIVGHHRGLSDPFVHGVPEFPATGSVWEPTPTEESPSADPTIIDVIAVSSYGRGMPSPLEDGEHRRTRTATDAHGRSSGRRVTATHNAPKWQAREPATTTDSIPPHDRHSLATREGASAKRPYGFGSAGLTSSMQVGERGMAKMAGMVASMAIASAMKTRRKPEAMLADS